MKFRTETLVVGVLLLLFGLSAAASAQRGRWEYLGQAHVDGDHDHDNIHVDAEGAFRAIRIEVHDAAIEFQRVVVHFENGDDFPVAIRDRIPAGGRTRRIDLPGDRRRIKSVEFWYSKGSWSDRKPGLSLYGQR